LSKVDPGDLANRMELKVADVIAGPAVSGPSPGRVSPIKHVGAIKSETDSVFSRLSIHA
jgi:hypothetical protein